MEEMIHITLKLHKLGLVVEHAQGYGDVLYVDASAYEHIKCTI